MEPIKRDLENYQENTPSQKPYDSQTINAPLSREQVLYLLGVMDISHTFDTMKKARGFETTLASFVAMANGKAGYSLLMVYGGIGNGKTRCCEATVIALYDRGLRVRRDRWSDIVRTMKSHFNGGGAITYEEYFHVLRSRNRIIFDDVGSGSTLGSWEWGELEDIIDYRYERKLFTIVTSNMDIKAFPERILSRFRDRSRARLILNEATDQRPLQ